MKKTTTACCALCQLNDISNGTSIELIGKKLKQLKIEKDKNTDVGISYGDGQTAVFVIVSPGEFVLEYNLKKLGFEQKHTFERRVGYAQVGDLKMYIKNL